MAGRGSVVGRALAEGRTVQVADVLADPEYEHLDAQKRASFRTFLAVPMLREGNPIGVIALGRSEVRPFTDRQIELVATFADQAVIAIENARLFEEVQGRTRELTDSLEQQTATSEVLKVISSSPGKLQPVFDAMLRNAVRICEAKFGNLFLIDADTVHWAAGVGTPPELAQFFTQSSWFRPTPGSHLDRVMRTKQVSHTADDTAEAVIGAAARHGGARSTVCVPMIKDDALVGAIFIYRTEVRPFTPKQIGLLKSFADQAVIAIENARLFEEVQAKTRGLTEVLTYQTGSANILKVIASSPTDVGPVLTAIVESACVICEAEEAHVVLRDGDELVFQVQHGAAPVVWKRQPINRLWVTGRAAVDRRAVHVHDLLSPEGDEFPDGRELARRDGARTVLAVPLLREGECIGVIALRRMEVRPFSEKQIELLQTFADQAVIAIGNVRLFDEVQARTRELAESLEQQTATSEVLQIISSSPGELEPVFQAMLENATRVCGAKFGIMNLYDRDSFESVALFNVPPAYVELRKNTRFRANPLGSLGTVIRTKQVAHTRDYRENPAYREGDPLVRELVEIAGARSWMVVPMLKEAELIGVITIYRQEIRPFTDKQIELVNNFAKQAVIAIENTRLLRELRQSLQQQTATSDVLKVISR